MEERKPPEEYPWWVRMGMGGFPGRRSMWFFFCLSSDCTIGSVIYGFWDLRFSSACCFSCRRYFAGRPSAGSTSVASGQDPIPAVSLACSLDDLAEPIHVYAPHQSVGPRVDEFAIPVEGEVAGRTILLDDLDVA